MRYPSFQSVGGTYSSSQIFLNRTWSMFSVTSTSYVSASAGIFSGPAAFPLLICLMDILISSIIGGVISIGRLEGVVLRSGWSSEVDSFKCSSECSTHLLRCFKTQ
ncbi:unnamed protein product [Schistosoma rodhaini]|nr:unnamed protein product [Schistosoma rodhaini]